MEPIIAIAELYSELDENQLEEAEQNLEAYLAVVVRIHRRLQAEVREANPSGNVAANLAGKLPGELAVAISENSLQISSC